MRSRGASLEVVLVDSTNSPPFRLDNKSHVALVYYQQGVDLLHELLPGASSPYAWDDLYQVGFTPIAASPV